MAMIATPIMIIIIASGSLLSIANSRSQLIIITLMGIVVVLQRNHFQYF